MSHTVLLGKHEALQVEAGSINTFENRILYISGGIM